MVHENLRVACMQLCSMEDVDGNLAMISSIMQGAGRSDIDLLLLPENATFLSNQHQLKDVVVQAANYHKVVSFFSELAKEYAMVVVAGSMLVQEGEASKPYNRCLVFDEYGNLTTHYDKMHLFDVDLGSESWQESAQTQAGESPQSFGVGKAWQVGLSICYDLRFPELYRAYSQQGCNIFTVPAAFTVPTGKAHWQTLLQARAIENQCYVLAAGQWGNHQDGRQTYGHSMVVDPWGEVLALQEQGEGLIIADLSWDKLMMLKQRMPVLQHRRLHLSRVS